MDERRYSGPRRRRSYTTRPGGDVGRTVWALIAASVVVFVLWHSVEGVGRDFMAQHFLVSVESVFSLRIWTMLTSAFSHVDANHLIFNMLALYVFGRPVGEALGTRALLHLYVAGALVASVGHVVFGLLAGSPNPALGASGAVMCIAVVFAALYPRATLLLFFVIPVPAAVAVLLYILIDMGGAIGGLLGGVGTGIAHAAHLGGALYGLGYYLVVLRGRRRR